MKSWRGVRLFATSAWTLVVCLVGMVGGSQLARARALPLHPPVVVFDDGELRLDQLQWLGTHNSYHLQTTSVIPAWRYSHPPLDQQLDAGVRHLELDLHYGRGSFPVRHLPFDSGSNCARLVDCLKAVSEWSEHHRGHQPLFILMEVKDDLDLDGMAGHYQELEATIRRVIGRDRILTPDDVRGRHRTLREAVASSGWPTLEAARGKLLFVLADSGDDYVASAALEHELMFVQGGLDDSRAVFVSYDDPLGQAAEIREAARRGLIARTRYNGEELELRPTRVGAALQSGAQLVTGDFPGTVVLPGGAPARCNPLTAPASCSPAAIARTAPPARP